MPHILIVGLGSTGRRYARYLGANGCSLSAVDPVSRSLHAAAHETRIDGCFESIEEALHVTSESLDGVIICSPPAVRVDHCLAAVAKSLPVLLDEPGVADIESALRLAAALDKSRVPVVIGSRWRGWPPFSDLRRLLEENAVGAVRDARIVVPAPAADAPAKGEQESFVAGIGQDGDALRAASPWIDLALWLFGVPATVTWRGEAIGGRQVEADDTIDMELGCRGGVQVSLRLDLAGHPQDCSIRCTGDAGTIVWEPNRLTVSGDAGSPPSGTNYDGPRADMCIAASREFLDVLRGSPVLTRTVDDCANVLRVLQSANESRTAGRVAPVRGVV